MALCGLPAGSHRHEEQALEFEAELRDGLQQEVPHGPGRAGPRSRGSRAPGDPGYESRPDAEDAEVEEVDDQTVAEFRKDAQLIIVSHQKRTMEACDALYGVTRRDGLCRVYAIRREEVAPGVE